MIRNLAQMAIAMLLVVSLVALPGCGGSKTPESKPASGHHEGDGHDHSKDKTGHYEGDGNDHSKDKGDHSGHDHEKEGEHK